MARRYCTPIAVGVCLMLLCVGTASGHDACRWQPDEATIAPMQESPNLQSDDRDMYTGKLRVYVTEMEGRWRDDDGIPFHNAFLSFAIPDDFVFLSDTDTLTWDVEWDGNDYTDNDGFTFGNVREEQVKVIAAVFNSATYPNYSDPPDGAEFDVHEVDACAAATSGVTGYNESNVDFTHTVMVEDGSTTW